MVVETLMQQFQSAMNGGKKPTKRKPVRAATKPKSTKTVRSVAKPVNRRVVPKKMRRSVGGFFDELNVAATEYAGKDKVKSAAGGMVVTTPMEPPVGMTATSMPPADGAGSMAGGRYRVFKKKVLPKKVGIKKAVAKPKRRILYGGYEVDEEVEEVEEVEVQEGGRRRVFKKKAAKKVAKPRPSSRGRMSYGGYEEEALGGRPRVFKKKVAKKVVKKVAKPKPRPSSKGRMTYGGFEFAGIQELEHFGRKKNIAPYLESDKK